MREPPVPIARKPDGLPQTRSLSSDPSKRADGPAVRDAGERITALLLVIAFAGVILVPVSSTVNNTFSNGVQTADGPAPVPPMPPCLLAAAPNATLQV